ncbi:MAG: hypothetical protein JWQ27_1421 [Ferruginibacter sp.]|nr:hypothetical protein [Ferruginibacter sp.]
MKNIIIYLLCLSAVSGFAQTRPILDTLPEIPSLKDSGFRYYRRIPGNFSSVSIDVLDNIYLITAGNQLKKLNANGDSIAAFSEVKKYGNPSLIDVSNPLKVLVYYKNFSTVVALDRLLSLRNTINFRKQNIFTVKTLANSYDNNIWLFDEQDLKLKKISEEGKLLQESTDWRLLFDTVPSPSQIIDSDNFVYLYDEAKGFYIFDYYGSFKNLLPFLHWEHVAVSGNKLYGIFNNNLYSYELKSLRLRNYPLPAFFGEYTDIKAMNGKVYLLKKDGLEIYSLL